MDLLEKRSVYPIIKLPKSVITILESYPQKLDAPSKPQFPVKPIKKTIEKPIKFSKQDTGFGSNLLVGIFGAIVIIIGLNSDKNGGKLIFAGLIFIIICLASYLIENSSDSENERKFQEASKLYPASLRKADEDYENEVSAYLKEVGQYEDGISIFIHQFESYNDLSDIYNSEEYTAKFRLQLVTDFFTSIPGPKSYGRINNSKKGLVEDYFFGFLKNRFGSHVSHQKYIMPIEGYDGEYYPDFVLHIGDVFTHDIGGVTLDSPEYVTWLSSYTGLSIDIEIDEPYAGASGIPIHYIGVDERRDSYFLDKGWLVIRFAEKQIVDDAESCVDFIAHQIDIATSFQLSCFDYNHNYKVKSVIQWDKDQSHAMAYSRFRNSYLPQNLAGKIKDELDIF